MNEHKTIRKEMLVGLAIGLAILVGFCYAVSAGALSVKQLPAQPELTVTEGKSIFYEDGSVDLQPASKSAGRTLQTTVEHDFLQGN